MVLDHGRANDDVLFALVPHRTQGLSLSGESRGWKDVWFLSNGLERGQFWTQAAGHRAKGQKGGGSEIAARIRGEDDEVHVRIGTGRAAGVETYQQDAGDVRLLRGPGGDAGEEWGEAHMRRRIN